MAASEVATMPNENNTLKIKNDRGGNRSQIVIPKSSSPLGEAAALTQQISVRSPAKEGDWVSGTFDFCK